MKMMLLLLAAVVLWTIDLVTAQTQPTTTPTMQLDLSSPRAAAKSMRRATAAEDLEALRQVIYAADEPHRRLADAYAAVVISGQRLSDAMRGQYGNGAGNHDIAGVSDDDLQAVDTAQPRTTGDSATIKLPGQGDRPLTLRRDNAGLWRVDLLAFANVSAEGDVASQCQMQLNLAAALSDLAMEISTGRYRTPADARAAVQDRVHGTIAKSLRAATTRSTTSPS
jgi:hypothetical protein